MNKREPNSASWVDVAVGIMATQQAVGHIGWLPRNGFGHGPGRRNKHRARA